jgi:2-polyprenyl-6-methoxyphenol hydroxylase-like FAD-dependent oxidoreductase
MPVTVRRERNRAIVIGASMAGLLAARTLADHFREVLLIERDELHDAFEHRRGVPQSRHTHVLLASGCRELESFFPGISREFADAGAVKGDVAEKVGWFVEGGRLRRFTSDVAGFGMTRPFLERIVRGRVLKLRNVRLIDGAGVDGLVVCTGGRRVMGVKAGEVTHSADLIVDAAGRGSRSPRWLEELGFERPSEEKVGIELRYTTRRFRRRPQDLGGNNAFIIPPTPTGKRGGGIVRQENEVFIVTLLTHFGDYPPSDVAGFIEFARSLPASDIYDVIRDAEPLGDAKTIRIPASVRHRYERLKRFPPGYLVIGDAVSSFNPIYGQGMSVAALEAAALDAVLRSHRRHLWRPFFRRIAKIVDVAWSISAGNDLRMAEASGKRSLVVTSINGYVARLLAAGHRDPAPARAFLRVSNLLASPISLMHPLLVWRVARDSFARARFSEAAE